MKLRDLELKDAPLMLEWMHDQSVVANLRGNFLGKTIKDAEEFIKLSRNKLQNIHLAIATDEDEYMGTVSLKNVDRDNNSADLLLRSESQQWEEAIRGMVWKRLFAGHLKNII